MSDPVVCLDLDGVIWRGDGPSPPPPAPSRCSATPAAVGFLSNNSSLMVADVVAKLAYAGVAADPTRC